MRYLPLILALCGNLYSQSPAEIWLDMTRTEQRCVKASFDYGKEWDIGFTLAAINAHETRGGRWPIRVGTAHNVLISENAFGNHHLRAYYAACRVYDTNKPTIWQQSRVAERLLFDREFDLLQSRLHLQEIMARHKGWMATWAAWNGGNGKYPRQIAAWVRFLKTKFK